jgi:hypothetical protein
MKELLNETMTRGAHELDMARMERANRRQWIVILLLIVLLVGSNAGWLYYEAQFTDEVTTVTQDLDTGDGDAVVSGTGDINYGTDKADGNNKETNP